MPYKSEKQRRWAHTPSGKEALGPEGVKEWDKASKGKDLPEESAEEATSGKGPTRTQGPGKSLPKAVKDARRVGREVHKDVSQKGSGFHSSQKGDKGYTRKEKHKKSDETLGEELTPMDETYRGLSFPLAKTLTWATRAEEDDDDETPVIDTPGFPPTKEGGGNVPDKGAAWGASIAADLTWSTHNCETFDDTGEKGEHPAWGLKSIIDRGVKTHEKPSGAKRIEDAENQTAKRDIPGKKFKSYSMVGAFDW